MKLVILFVSVFLAKYALVEAVKGAGTGKTNTLTFAVNFQFEWKFNGVTSRMITCSGAVIKTTIVLTAGKCVRVPAANIKVYGISAIGTGTSVVPSKTIIHPKFNVSTLEFNLAALVVTAITGTAEIALPTAGQPYCAMEVFFAGAGRPSSTGAIPTEMKMGSSGAVWVKDCNCNPLNPLSVNSSFVKARETDYCHTQQSYPESLCLGDEGAPMAVKKDVNSANPDILVSIYSITSQSGNCERDGYAIGERLTKSLVWLKEIINSN